MFSSLPKCSLLWLFICSFSGGGRWCISWWQHRVNKTLEPGKVLSQGRETSLEFWHGQKFSDLISISSVHATEKLHSIIVAESIASIFRATEIAHIHLNICHVHVDHDDIGIHTTF